MDELDWTLGALLLSMIAQVVTLVTQMWVWRTESYGLGVTVMEWYIRIFIVAAVIWTVYCWWQRS